MVVRIEFKGGPIDGFQAEVDDSLTGDVPLLIAATPPPIGDWKPLYHRSLKFTAEGRLLYEFKPWLGPAWLKPVEAGR